MPKIEVTQKKIERALKACCTEEPADHDPCKDCYLCNLRDDTGRMSTGRSCFEYLAHDIIDYIRRINDFEHSQCAKLLAEISQYRAVITQMDPDFFTRKCRVCGCDWNHPCEGGCCWVKDDLCSKCAQMADTEADKERIEHESV